MADGLELQHPEVRLESYCYFRSQYGRYQSHRKHFPQLNYSVICKLELQHGRRCQVHAQNDIKYMQANDSVGSTRDAQQQPQSSGVSADNEQYLTAIPEANPIKKRQKLLPHSIFPMLPLPDFIFSSEVPESTTASFSVSTQNPQRFILPSPFLNIIFKEPIYTYSQRAQKSNNADFGCFKVKFTESTVHDKAKVQQLNSINQKAYVTDNNSKQPNPTLSHNHQPYHCKSVDLQRFTRKLQDKIEEQSKMSQTNSEELRQLKPQSKMSLQFESRFESGNLCFASKSTQQQNTYHLLLARDFNTSKCTQWFFFRASNNIAGKATFHIINFIKNYSIFQNGMKVCVAAKSNSFHWMRGCFDIKYRRTNIPIYLNSKANVKNLNLDSSRCYYSLSFSYNFQKNNDQVYFAYCYPYTYTMLENFMWKADETCQHFKRRNIATTPGGNCVDIVTITNFKQKLFQKRTVVIMARVHPGETPSSFVCEGMMKYLISETAEAIALRDSFVFKFIPMLNPDGVINGSYRCSLSGYDLNRVWHRADKVSHPEVYSARKNIFEIQQKEKIFLIVDLHAHSKKKGIFMYGSQNKNNPYLCRQIPFLLWKNISQFNYHQCNFGMRLGREGTSRLFLHQELALNNSFTMEHSFCGPLKERIHFTSRDYAKFGINFLNTINKYFYCLRKKTNQNQEDDYYQQLYSNKELVKVGEGEDGDSSSDEQLDKCPLNQAKNIVLEDKKTVVKVESLRMSEGSIKKRKVSGRTFQKKAKIQKNTLSYFREPTIVKFIHTNRFFQTSRPIPVAGSSFRDRIEQLQIASPQSKDRDCHSSMNHSNSKNISTDKKAAIRDTFRYEEEEEINSLTNLFLPSLTSASYKKYSRKTSNPRNMVHIGKNLIENAIIIKQQIRSVSRKKPTWKDHARSFL